MAFRAGAIVALLCLATATHTAHAKDPDVGKGMVEIVESKGYPIEEHFVTTPDGYILGVFRIPGGRGSMDLTATNASTLRVGATGKPVVVLQHGLLDSSYTWVNNFPTQSLGFILADAGFDVWLPNARGNFYSMKHRTLDPKKAPFWQFTWDDMALQDIPACIDYILAATGKPKLSWVGHSQGTTSMFAALSRNEGQIVSKVNFFAALAPVAYVHHANSIVLQLAAGLDLGALLHLLGLQEFLPDASILQALDPAICSILPTGCDVILYLICGQTHNINASRIAVYVSETPAGTSVQNMEHWAQGVRTESFQMYDYGCGLLGCPNEKHYGQKTPPGYPLGNITTPTALYWGGNDILGNPTDVQQLIDDLPRSTVVSVSEWKEAAHLDFTWGVNANENVYLPLLKQLQAYKTL